MKMVVILTTVNGDMFVSLPMTTKKATNLYEKMADKVGENPIIGELELLPEFGHQGDAFTEIVFKEG